MNWQEVIETHKNRLESLLLLQSFGYFAGNNHGFIIKMERLSYKTPTELLNAILEICVQRMRPYKNTSKQYDRVKVEISASRSGIYVEYTTGGTNQ